MSDDTFDSAWGRMTDPDVEAQAAQPADSAPAEEQQPVLGPPLRVLVVVSADSVPVAPWPQGWRVAAAGPIEGFVTLVFEHELTDSPVAQLAAVTGVLSIVKGAGLTPTWWSIEARSRFPHEAQDEARSMDDDLSAWLKGPAED